MVCKVCSRETENVYCTLHFKAYTKLSINFDMWKKTSDILWKKYLVELQKNSLTGEWAKEVINELIMGENGNVW
jgi:hypothetical protein